MTARRSQKEIRSARREATGRPGLFADSSCSKNESKATGERAVLGKVRWVKVRADGWRIKRQGPRRAARLSRFVFPKHANPRDRGSHRDPPPDVPRGRIAAAAAASSQRDAEPTADFRCSFHILAPPDERGAFPYRCAPVHLRPVPARPTAATVRKFFRRRVSSTLTHASRRPSARPGRSVIR